MIKKLAFKNIKKDLSVYSLYIFALSISIAAFYMYNAFHFQTLESIDTNSMRAEQGASALFFISIITILLMGLLCMFGTKFFMTFKSKEFALYRLNGMTKTMLVKLIFLENAIIFGLSLIFGIIAGEFIKFIVTIILKDQFLLSELKLENKFSLTVFLATIVIVMIIYLIASLFTTMYIQKNSIKILFNSNRHNEQTINILSIPKIIFKLLTSILILLLNYALIVTSMKNIFETSNPTIFLGIILLILISGALAVFEFYQVIGQIYLKVIPKQIKYKGINNFTFSVLGRKVQTTYKSISVISLLLLLSFFSVITANSFIFLGEKFTISSDYIIHGTSQANLDDLELTPLLKDAETVKYQTYNLPEEYSFSIMKLSDLNNLQKLSGKEIFPDLKNRTYYTNVAPSTESKELVLNEQIFSFAAQLSDINNFQPGNLVIINDNEFNQIIPLDVQNQSEFYNLAINSKNKELQTKINQLIAQGDSFNIVSRQDLFITALQFKLTFVGILFFSSLIFLNVLLAIFGLIIITDAYSNKAEFKKVSLLGFSTNQMNKSITNIILIYFFLPLVLFVPNIFFGSQVVTGTLDTLGSSTNVFIIVGIIFLLYGLIIKRIYQKIIFSN
ncbi:MAG: FtsX-like permease family protein [Mycoplasmatales bacterium]